MSVLATLSIQQDPPKSVITRGYTFATRKLSDKLLLSETNIEYQIVNRFTSLYIHSELVLGKLKTPVEGFSPLETLYIDCTANPRCVISALHVGYFGAASCTVLDRSALRYRLLRAF